MQAESCGLARKGINRLFVLTVFRGFGFLASFDLVYCSFLLLGIRRCSALGRPLQVLSLHAPQTPETINMISHEQFAVMPPNAIIINTARGTLIDFDALHEALKSNKIAGAGLDCIPQEPPVDIHPLLQAYRDREAWLDGRMIVTSHVAYWSPQAEADIRRLSAETMASAVVEGRKPQNVIDPSSW